MLLDRSIQILIARSELTKEFNISPFVTFSKRTPFCRPSRLPLQIEKYALVLSTSTADGKLSPSMLQSQIRKGLDLVPIPPVTPFAAVKPESPLTTIGEWEVKPGQADASGIIKFCKTPTTPTGTCGHGTVPPSRLGCESGTTIDRRPIKRIIVMERKSSFAGLVTRSRINTVTDK